MPLDAKIEQEESEESLWHRLTTILVQSHVLADYYDASRTFLVQLNDVRRGLQQYSTQRFSQLWTCRSETLDHWAHNLKSSGIVECNSPPRNKPAVCLYRRIRTANRKGPLT